MGASRANEAILVLINDNFEILNYLCYSHVSLEHVLANQIILHGYQVYECD